MNGAELLVAARAALGPHYDLRLVSSFPRPFTASDISDLWKRLYFAGLPESCRVTWAPRRRSVYLQQIWFEVAGLPREDVVAVHRSIESALTEVGLPVTSVSSVRRS